VLVCAWIVAFSGAPNTTLGLNSVITISPTCSGSTALARASALGAEAPAALPNMLAASGSRAACR